MRNFCSIIRRTPYNPDLIICNSLWPIQCSVFFQNRYIYATLTLQLIKGETAEKLMAMLYKIIDDGSEEVAMRSNKVVCKEVVLSLRRRN